MKKDFTFEEYVREACFEEANKEGIPVLDDDMEDYFETWLQQADPAILLEIGERFSKALMEQFRTEMLTTLHELKEATDSLNETNGKLKALLNSRKHE